jgi:hypothetical protein
MPQHGARIDTWAFEVIKLGTNQNQISHYTFEKDLKFTLMHHDQSTWPDKTMIKREGWIIKTNDPPLSSL